MLTEELSAKIVTVEICRRLGCGDRLTVIEHMGKQDLLRSMRRKLDAWRVLPLPRFVVLRDNDNVPNCRAAKAELESAIPQRPGLEVRVRLIMQELEAWYLCDMPALSLAGLIAPQALESVSSKAKFRQPESMADPKTAFRSLTHVSGAISAARQIAPHLDIENAKSPSFAHYINALRWAAA